MTPLDLNEIHSLTDFQRNAKEHISRMRKSRRPLVLTVNGKAAMVGLDVKSYQEMMETVERAEAIVGIRQGLEEMKRGEGTEAGEFLAAMRKKYKISERA